MTAASPATTSTRTTAAAFAVAGPSTTPVGVGAGGLRRPLARPAAFLGVALAIAVALGGLRGQQAHAFDAATTHAGLTQQALLASRLHKILGRRLARPLGLLDPVALHAELMPETQRRLLQARLFALDPAGGYRPGADGVASALAWTVAGTVIAKSSPERMRNFFFDPSTGAGLRDDAAVAGTLHAVRQVVDGGNLRDVMTGASFAFEGEPSTKWLEAPENDGGLRAFRDELERAVADPDPAQRSCALARALLALGGALAVLEEAGNPAAVRNDFRASYLRGAPAAPFDRRSSFEHAVAELYGMSGVPAARAVVRRDSVAAFFSAADGQGLADRTQRRFFSDGTLPEDGIVDRDTSAADIVKAARASLTYALPTIPRLELREMGLRHYVTVSDGPGTPSRRALAYERVPGRVRFFLDGAVYLDTARTVLPEIAAYGAGFVDHVFRAEIVLSLEGDRVRATVGGSAGKARGGTLRLFAEDAEGRRKEIGSFASDGAGIDTASASLPPGTRRAAAVLRGNDDAGPVVAFGELIVPVRR